jgi:hypothetical protein
MANPLEQFGAPKKKTESAESAETPEALEKQLEDELEGLKRDSEGLSAELMQVDTEQLNPQEKGFFEIAKGAALDLANKVFDFVEQHKEVTAAVVLVAAVASAALLFRAIGTEGTFETIRGMRQQFVPGPEYPGAAIHAARIIGFGASLMAACGSFGALLESGDEAIKQSQS